MKESNEQTLFKKITIEKEKRNGQFTTGEKDKERKKERKKERNEQTLLK